MFNTNLIFTNHDRPKIAQLFFRSINKPWKVQQIRYTLRRNEHNSNMTLFLFIKFFKNNKYK